jgi:hypothetical protein
LPFIFASALFEPNLLLVPPVKITFFIAWLL